MATTPLHEVHQQLGAAMTDFAGWSMPLRYGSDVAEHHAVRTAAGLFDLSHMGEVFVRGPQAAAALDWALVSEPSAIGLGRARYSMIVDADGGILDDLVVYRLGEQEFLVVANASNAALVAGELTSRAADFEATISDESEQWALIAAQGPASAAIVTAVTGQDLTGLRYYAIDAASIAGHPVLLARTGYTGEDGFEVYCRTEAAVDVWAQLSRAGTAHGMVPAGLACRDSLRLEAGMPLYGHELTSALSPFDVGMGRVVKLDKPGGFVGAEALRRAAQQPARYALVGLRAQGRRAPRAGYALLREPGGPQIGTVTSGSPSPTLGHPIAMALVDAPAPQVGDQLVVDVRGKTEAVTVVALPFYSRAR